MTPDPLVRLLDEASDRYSAGYYQGEDEPAYMELLANVAREHIAAEIEDIPLRPWDMDDADSAEARSARAYGSGLLDATRIARGGTP